MPEAWTKDRKRRKKTGVPVDIAFQTKAEIALEQVQRARQRGIPQGVVLADAGYGNDTRFRTALTEMELTYVMGVQSTVTVWKPGEEPKPAPARKGSLGVHANSYRVTQNTNQSRRKNWPYHYRPRLGTR